MIRRFAAGALVIFLAVGCASKSKPTGITGDVKPSVQQAKGVTVTATPFVTADKLGDEFDRNPADIGFLAIQLDVKNDSADSVTLGQPGVVLARPEKPNLPAARVAPLYIRKMDAGKKLDFKGFFKSGSENEAMDKRVADWNNKSLPASLDVDAGSSETNFVYFDFRGEKQAVEKIPPAVYTLMVNISRDGGGKWETVSLPIDLTSIKYP
jgi:hypothetical protein